MGARTGRPRCCWLPEPRRFPGRCGLAVASPRRQSPGWGREEAKASSGHTVRTRAGVRAGAGGAVWGRGWGRLRPGREAGAAAGVGRLAERRAPGSRTPLGLCEVSAGRRGYLRGRGARRVLRPGRRRGRSALEAGRGGQAESAGERARARDPLGLVTHFIPVTTRARLERRPMGRWGGQLLRRAPAFAAAGARRAPRSERPPLPPRAGSVSGRGSGAWTAGCAGPRASDRLLSACGADHPGRGRGSTGTQRHEVYVPLGVFCFRTSPE